MKTPKHMIDLVTRNIHGAWVIYGIDGVKQFYNYTKAQAIQKYKDNCARKYVVNE